MRKFREDRALGKYLLFSVLTLGVYAFYHQYRMICDINEMLQDEGKRTANVPLLLLLCILTCGMYALYWHYCLGRRLEMSLAWRGVFYDISGGILLAYALFSVQLPFFALIAQYKIIHATNLLARCTALSSSNVPFI